MVVAVGCSFNTLWILKPSYWAGSWCPSPMTPNIECILTQKNFSIPFHRFLDWSATTFKPSHNQTFPLNTWMCQYLNMQRAHTDLFSPKAQTIYWVQLLCVGTHTAKSFPRNYSSCLSRTWLLPVTYSDYGPCDTHEIWHVRNNWNQAKACRAIARRRSYGHGGADIFRAAVRLRPQEGRLEGNKPFKPRGR